MFSSQFKPLRKTLKNMLRKRIEEAESPLTVISDPGDVYFCYSIPEFSEAWKSREFEKWKKDSCTLFNVLFMDYELYRVKFTKLEMLECKLYLLDNVKCVPLSSNFSLFFIHAVEDWIRETYPEHEFRSFFDWKEPQEEN